MANESEKSLVDKKSFADLFTVGETIQSGGAPNRKNAARLEILEIDDQRVRFRPLGKKTRQSIPYDYLQLLTDNLEEVNPRSIEKSVNVIREKAYFKKDTTTEVYAYGFAKEIQRRRAESLGLDFVSSGEELAAKSYEDGKHTAVIVDRYERNPRNRRLCIDHHGSACIVCGFEASKKYQNVKDGYIHVHHLKLVSDGVQMVDPKKDLVPVCPNCHAMLHTKVPPLTPDELRKRLM